MRVPGPDTCPDSRVGIVGIPFDCGAHPVRVGARMGPSAIREQSLLLRPYNPPEFDFDPLARLRVTDWGDVDVIPGRIEDGFEKIEAVITAVIGSGALPLTMGGDGAVTLPQIRAVHKRYDDLVVLHIDSHTDTNPAPETGHDTGTTFTRAAQEGLVDVSRSLHVGIRGTFRMPGILANAAMLGYETILMSQIDEMGIKGLVTYIREKCGDRPVYLCFDMDVFDPSCAPGVCAPSWGGLHAREGLSILRGLGGLNIVAADV
ncbi:MAG: arginase family protein, partial [Burkholderiales bacterium]|nr:arginase family protein [Burkholderiales bacterium]